ncbi:hypothetical protein IFM89_008657 [Coptis chinensis]|uniref:F-box/LRR-repeat protein 15/At3g58940/PEG3-like LRR domain-containing protein n=1 Tax=Coptis chinensis TaxID=261450 RepID=A0A835GVC8_9MAGN|nr:hypothetical protein IFM89_008657 [Coptis chinensis]
MDRIGYLPDPVRSHIVSFLPMKDAFRSTILSIGWRGICSSLSKLEFTHQYHRDLFSRKTFKDLIERTLYLHDGSDVQRFRLEPIVDGETICAHHVNAWISFALLHNIQDLELRFWLSVKPEKLPCRLFTSSTLKVLSLSEMRSLKWPRIIKFPMLKTFRLKNVRLPDEITANKLFSSCTFPALEDLSIRNWGFEIDTLSICVPGLKCLELLLPKKGLNLKVSIQNLRKINYLGSVAPNFESLNLLSLANANFQLSSPDTFFSNDTDGESNSASNILLGLHNAETLYFGCRFIELCLILILTYSDLFD